MLPWRAAQHSKVHVAKQLDPRRVTYLEVGVQVTGAGCWQAKTGRRKLSSASTAQAGGRKGECLEWCNQQPQSQVTCSNTASRLMALRAHSLKLGLLHACWLVVGGCCVAYWLWCVSPCALCIPVSCTHGNHTRTQPMMWQLGHVAQQLWLGGLARQAGGLTSRALPLGQPLLPHSRPAAGPVQPAAPIAVAAVRAAPTAPAACPLLALQGAAAASLVGCSRGGLSPSGHRPGQRHSAEKGKQEDRQSAHLPAAPRCAAHCCPVGRFLHACKGCAHSEWSGTAACMHSAGGWQEGKGAGCAGAQEGVCWRQGMEKARGLCEGAGDGKRQRWSTTGLQRRCKHAQVGSPASSHAPSGSLGCLRFLAG